ncbi:hypothetical protein L218DRAFT_837357, partial [Marasmius fiardii PR-910]
HDSHARFPQPKCAAGTRKKILTELLEWACSDLSEDIPGVCWVRGSAGTGKSAIAQTVAEACEGEQLLATFCFSRSDPNQDNSRYLALAIADAIATTIPSLRETILHTVDNRQDIMHASLEAQFKALVIQPLLDWRNHVPDSHSTSDTTPASSTLVIIDGLDECVESREQQQILSLLLQVMKHRLPIRFLVCSRPEPKIQERFNQEDLHQFTKFMTLNGDPDVDQDIETMLCTEFSNICNSSRCRGMIFPDPWPSKRDLQTLVDKSSGQFIYPATILKF